VSARRSCFLDDCGLALDDVSVAEVKEKDEK
jgi:hypothetical protein